MGFNRLTADPFLDISLGQVPGVSIVNKFGRNPDIDTTTDPEEVWSQGGLWVPPTYATGAQLHDIASGSANDTAAGTGARTIRIHGLDENWNEVSEDISMNGLSAVETSNTYWRIDRMYTLTHGTGGANAGAILATAKTDGTVTAAMSAFTGQTTMAIYTVPAGKRAYITGIYASIIRGGASTNAELSLITSGPMDTEFPASRTRFTWGIETTGSSFSNVQRNAYPSVAAKHDIKLRINTVGANDTDISGGFDLILVDEPYVY